VKYRTRQNSTCLRCTDDDLERLRGRGDGVALRFPSCAAKRNQKGPAKPFTKKPPKISDSRSHGFHLLETLTILPCGCGEKRSSAGVGAMLCVPTSELSVDERVMRVDELDSDGNVETASIDCPLVTGRRRTVTLLAATAVTTGCCCCWWRVVTAAAAEVVAADAFDADCALDEFAPLVSIDVDVGGGSSDSLPINAVVDVVAVSTMAVVDGVANVLKSIARVRVRLATNGRATLTVSSMLVSTAVVIVAELLDELLFVCALAPPPPPPVDDDDDDAVPVIMTTNANGVECTGANLWRQRTLKKRVQRRRRLTCTFRLPQRRTRYETALFASLAVRRLERRRRLFVVR
jgi:hypothetical protein